MEDVKPREFTLAAFAPDGKLLAVGGGEKDVVVWDATTGGEVYRLKLRPQQTARWLAFHPSGAPLYAATNYGILIYRPDTRQTSKLLGVSDSALSAALDPPRRRLVWYHVHAAILVRDTTTHLTFADVSDGAEPRQLWRRPPVDPPNGGRANHLAFLPDGDRFVSAEVDYSQTRYGDWRLVIRAADTGNALHRITGPGTECDQLAVSPHGDRLATRLKTTLHVFDCRDVEAEPRVFKNDNRKHFTGVAFHPSGKYLAATSNDATVKLYDTSSWEVAKTYTWEIGRMRSVAFSPDGTLAAAGSDTGKVVVWDIDL